VYSSFFWYLSTPAFLSVFKRYLYSRLWPVIFSCLIVRFSCVCRSQKNVSATTDLCEDVYLFSFYLGFLGPFITFCGFSDFYLLVLVFFCFVSTLTFMILLHNVMTPKNFAKFFLSLSLQKLTIFLLISMSLSLFVHCRAKTNFFFPLWYQFKVPMNILFCRLYLKFLELWNPSVSRDLSLYLHTWEREMSIHLSICVPFQMLLYIQPLLTSQGLSFTQLHDYSILLYSVLHLQHNAYNAASFMKRLLWPWTVLFINFYGFVFELCFCAYIVYEFI